MLASREFTFSASHILPRHEGKCKNLHGHNWKVIVTVHGVVDPATGFVMDFAVLKKIVQPMIDRFDHRHLNCFVRYPSSENIAAHLADHISAKLKVDYAEFKLDRLVVSVSETANTFTVWDSANRNDFYMLNDGPSAEWRSPTMPAHVFSYPVPEAIKLAKEQADALFKAWEVQQTALEQLILYVDSMDANPELPDWEKAKKAEQEAIDNARKVGQ